MAGDNHEAAIDGAHYQPLEDAVLADTVGEPGDGILVGMGSLVVGIEIELVERNLGGFHFMGTFLSFGRPAVSGIGGGEEMPQNGE